MADLAAPCGLFCGSCPLYKAWQDPEFHKTLAEKMKVPPEKAKCPGCRPASGSVTPIGETCQTYRCAQEKQVSFCYQCNAFPCHKLAPCADRAQLLPHNLKVFSLLALKNMGREKWEKEYPSMARHYFRGQMVLGAGPKV